MLKVVHEENETHEKSAVCGGSLLDEIVRDGARQLLAVAVQAEVAAYIEAHAHEVDEAGRRLVVRNGHHQSREVTTAAGAVPVRAPRVNDKRVDEATGERVRFSSAILPAWARKSPQVAEVLPLLYRHGLSSLDFAPALTQFLGTGHGLSPTTITRLTKAWQDEARAFNHCHRLNHPTWLAPARKRSGRGPCHVGRRKRPTCGPTHEGRGAGSPPRMRKLPAR